MQDENHVHQKKVGAISHCITYGLASPKTCICQVYYYTTCKKVNPKSNRPQRLTRSWNSLMPYLTMKSASHFLSELERITLKSPMQIIALSVSATFLKDLNTIQCSISLLLT